MKIYVDLLFLINIFFDFILLLTVSIILKRHIKIYRIILGSLVGGVSIFFLFLNINTIILFILKIFIAIFMILVTFKYKDIKYFIKNISYLYLVSIILGGALYLFNIEFSYKNNGLIFYNNGMSINIIILLIISPIILYLYIKEMKEYKNNYDKYYKIKITFNNNKTIELNAFLDTGNNLIDPYKKRPIVLVEYNIIKKYIINEKLLIVPFNTIKEKSLLECIKVKNIIINNKEYKNILIGLIKEKIYIDGIECILNNNIDFT